MSTTDPPTVDPNRSTPGGEVGAAGASDVEHPASVRLGEIQRLAGFLDQVLDLDEPQRQAWLRGLESRKPADAGRLRDLLARHGLPETNDILQRGPAFELSKADIEATGVADLRVESWMAGTQVGPYRLLRELGRGGMGEVWLAEPADGQLKRRVALKLPTLVSRRQLLVQRFERERDILASLAHANIARLYDAGFAADGQPYLALEYVEGQPIDVYCQQRLLPIEARLRLLLQVAEAVAFAHSRLVLHRDLKPSNILVTDGGQVRLLDFGIAKLMEGDSVGETELTHNIGRALTLDYASPEQLRGDAIGTASDVYSLAVVAFEVLAGVRPYRLKRQALATIDAVIEATAIPAASAAALDRADRARLVGDLDAILNKALKKSAIERYATVDAMAQDWRRYLAGQRVAARPDTLAYRASRWARQYRRPLLAAAVVGVAFGLAIGVGSAAVVVASLAVGLAAALWQARRAAIERDQALALADRNFAVNVFLDTLLTKAARGGPLTAEQLLERSERMIESEVRGNPVHRAFVLGVLANSYSQLDHTARAEQLYAKALEACRDAGDASLRDSLTSRHALMAARLGRPAEAVRAIDAILERSNTTPEVRAEVHANRATVAQWEGDFVAALRHATDALRWYRAAKHLPRRQEPVYLAVLGWAYHLNARSDEASRHFEASMSAFQALGLEDSPAALQHMTTWALAHQERGDLPRSLEIFDRCIAAALRSSTENTMSPYPYANRAYTLTHMGRYEAAESGYRRSLEMATERSMPLLAYNIRFCLVELYAEQGRLSDADRELQEAESQRSFEVPEASAAMFARQIAEARIGLLRGDPAKAIEVYTTALESKRMAAGSINALLGRSAAYLFAGRLDQAEADAREAIDFSRGLQGKTGVSFRTGLAQLALARVQQRRELRAESADTASSSLVELSATLDAQHPALSEARRIAALPVG